MKKLTKKKRAKRAKELILEEKIAELARVMAECDAEDTWIQRVEHLTDIYINGYAKLTKADVVDAEEQGILGA